MTFLCNADAPDFSLLTKIILESPASELGKQEPGTTVPSATISLNLVSIPTVLKA